MWIEKQLIVAFLVVGGGWLAGQPVAVLGQERGTGAIQAIEEAFSRGDVETLLHRAAPQVEIAVFEPSRLYSRGQARYVLRTFFRAYPPRRFVLRDYFETHSGWFAEGDFWHVRGEEPLRIYLRLRQRAGRWELREILVEEGEHR
ncbi:DUF4783 domain-containing protein [Rhodocaloribacter litoris]|uniref:DUF4783 domain-containing protein n=1 Tax=Rhodocaloribacter litoris TaxID=2558931 RepID=UPI001421C3F1|nr:DUF4783 domain-containing protein [Rhodocaloribacter litoris]QXD15036.1 DUF4783 domain-containing protein [Rhodocaloribacter litoris]GIV62170.1 MAG: hypothetical protein KatS3mg044_1036 [Rhodothermaceae bacterium]